MTVPGNMSGEIETGRRIMALSSGLSLLVLGFPVTPTTIGVILASTGLFAGGIVRFVLGYSPATGSTGDLKTVRSRSTGLRMSPILTAIQQPTAEQN
jgi:hypothetical protein